MKHSVPRRFKMLFLILAVLSSSMVSIVMRISTDKISANISMLAVNYLVCSFLGAAYAGFDLLSMAAEGFSLMVALGAVAGVLYLAGFVLLQWSIRRNGVVLSATFQKLGLLVSMVVSVTCFGERPALWHWFAFVLALAAIVLMNRRSCGEKAGSMAGLLLLLLSCGGCDVMSKVFEVYGNANLSGHFLLYTFLTALGLCILLIAVRKQGLPGKAEWSFGFLVGIPNYFAAKFLLASLTSLPAVIVYPVYSVATLLVVTIAGVLLFRERLRNHQWAALGMILLSLILLNV